MLRGVAGGGGDEKPSFSFDPDFVKGILSKSKSKSASNAPPNSKERLPFGDRTPIVQNALKLLQQRQSLSAGAPSNSQQQQGNSAPPVEVSAQNDPSQKLASVSIAQKSEEGEGGERAAISLPPKENLILSGRSESEVSVDANQGPPPSQGRNTDARNALISKTGREFGPDIALKVGPNIVDKKNVGKEAAAGEKIVGDKSKDIINENSSITEVLNILAFLLNNGEQRNSSVITEFSYEHVNGIFGKLYDSFNGNDPLFDIKKLTPSESSAGVKGTGSITPDVEITIPETILKRDERYDLKEPIKIKSKDIQPLITACILQMVNILENTRQVFGGWAKLFKGMQGGSNSKSKTKTRRNNRRRH